MDVSLILEYGWVLLVLVGLEGLLAADNALVLAIMVKHLPEEARKRALFYGLAGAFVFRFLSLFIISFLVDVWQVQAIGAVYLIFIALNHIFRKVLVKKGENGSKKRKRAKRALPFGRRFSRSSWPTSLLRSIPFLRLSLWRWPCRKAACPESVGWTGDNSSSSLRAGSSD